MKYFTGLPFVIPCFLVFLSGCFLTSSASSEDYDIRGTWNLMAVDNVTQETRSTVVNFSGSKESGTFVDTLWGNNNTPPGTYTVQGKKVTLKKANHPPDNDGMNGEGEFVDADIVSGTFSDYARHAGTWNMTRVD